MSTDILTVAPPRSDGLHKKLAAIAATISHIPKRGFNDFHKYAYVMEADILDAVRSELSSHSIMLVPSIETVQRDGTLTTILMSFSFVDGETGEVWQSRWAGTGDDKGDKGLYKAITGATKYFLLKTFLMPTGDDPESDTATDKRAAKPMKSAEPQARCIRCGSTDVPAGREICRTCIQLQEQRTSGRARPADSAPETGAMPPTQAEVPAGVASGPGVPPEAPARPPANAPEAKPARKRSAAQEVHARAFGLMEMYGISVEKAGQPDRHAIYGRALGLGRLATIDEVKKFGEKEWRIICSWLRDTFEPPPGEPPPGVA